MKLGSKTSILGLALLLVLASAALATEKGFLWDGSHWQEMSRDQKVAYLKGVGNMADFETGAGLGARAMCISKAFVKELQTKSVADIITEVDKFYLDNPSKRNTPVIEVILKKFTQLCPAEPKGEKK